MALIIYDLLILAVAPLLFLLVLWDFFAVRTFWGSWRRRFAIDLPEPLPDAPLLWLHAASVGETRAIEGLIRRIKIDYPGLRLLLTNTSQTGHDLAKRLDLGHIYTFLPFDLPGLPGRLVDRCRPLALVIIETEFWPNLLADCDRRGVPVMVVNGRLSPKREKIYRALAPFYREILRPVRRFLMQGGQDADRLLTMGIDPTKIQVVGDLKIDQAIELSSDVDSSKVREGLGLPAGPIFVAGSLHGGEDKPIIEAFVQLRREFPDLFLVLAPRHMRDLPGMQSTLNDHGVHFRLRSGRSQCGIGSDARESVLVLDTIGELAMTYSVATLAFVGGSLVPRGGHSLFEPAAFGCPILVGPHDQNFSEETERLRRVGAAVRVEDAGSVHRAARHWLASPEEGRRAGQEARRALSEMAGATHRVLEELRTILHSSSEDPQARIGHPRASC